ncbi:MAG: histidine--tRNA ligase [Ignisphaera sp.]|uniref:Histidine--tRNA ligase n=1 Tax=Ignisphaera aggregans TaxID=334771 RepID=A0A7J3MXN4_9CREN
MHISYEPVRGFRDYIPPESELLTWVCQTFAEVVKRFGYIEVRTPTVESFQIFALKSGEEIRESMFVFKDKAGREVALRPEITPSIVRVYLKELRHWSKPIRIYYIGNVFRYDEPQFGRYREFTQAGVEILGGDEVYYDVELIELLEEFYDAIDLRDRKYKVNNVGIFRELANRAGIEDSDVDRFLHYLDKGVYDKAIELFIAKGSYEEAKILEILAKPKSESQDAMNVLREVLSNTKDNSRIMRHVELLERYIEMVRGIGADVIVEPLFARGIAYYTDIIFEVVVPSMSISIAGGGRYNNLTTIYGGENLSTTGFAIGVERTMLALMSRGIKSVPLHGKRVLLILLVDDMKAFAKIYRIAKELRNKGFTVQLEVSSSVSKLSRWLEYASKYSFKHVIIIGKREIERNVVTVKDMERWSQEEIEVDRLLEKLIEKE